MWEDKIHDILLDKSRVTVGQVAIDGLAFETPAPPAFVNMPFEIYDVRKVGTVRDGLLFQQGKSSRAGRLAYQSIQMPPIARGGSHEGALRMFT